MRRAGRLFGGLRRISLRGSKGGGRYYHTRGGSSVSEARRV